MSTDDTLERVSLVAESERLRAVSMFFQQPALESVLTDGISQQVSGRGEIVETRNLLPAYLDMSVAGCS